MGMRQWSSEALKIKVVNVVGARPNFMKIAPIVKEMARHPEFSPLLVHTGQHYDKNMSQLFFEELELPAPDISLRVGSGSHAEQTARIMVKFEKFLLREHADLVLVVGDVNSTLACALSAVKLGIPVGHVEAGLRSFDRAMPEEINRVVTDALSDYLFITEKSAEINLLNEGRPRDSIHFVGNVMVDTLLANKKKANKSKVLSRLRVRSKDYAVLTLHRPSNVDSAEKFTEILEALEVIKNHVKIVYPAHPRARKRILELNFQRRFPFLSREERIATSNGVIMVKPLPYLDFLKLMSEAAVVLTDSGGIQDETTACSVPCVTLRDTTERPVTVCEGTNVLAGTTKERIVEETLKVLSGKTKLSKVPAKWDGRAAERIVNILLRHFSRRPRNRYNCTLQR